MSSPFQIAASRKDCPAWEQKDLREAEGYAARFFPQIKPGNDGKAPDPVTAASWLKAIAESTAIQKHATMAQQWDRAVVMPSDLYYDAKHGFMEQVSETRTGIVARSPTPAKLAQVDFVALLTELFAANSVWNYSHFNNSSQVKISQFMNT